MTRAGQGQSDRPVLVIGGGPSGSAAALLLAAWGHAVRVVARPAAEARLAVSLPPSCQKLFDVIGVSDTIARANFVRSTGNTVWWGSEEPRVERFAADGLGWQADAHRLAAVLLDAARRAGAAVEARSVSDADVAGAPLVLDCSGRTGVLARAQGLRRYAEGPRTVGLVGEWQSDRPWPVPDDSHTLVESYDDGWVWSVPTAPGSRHVAAMVDPHRSGLARGGTAREVYLAEIAKTRAFRSFAAAASLVAGPSGWDASTYGARQYAGNGWLLVGDAGSFIDPLSSAGVKKAMASGWLAAVTAHTYLTKPEMRGHALAFYSAREHEIERHQARATQRFLAEAASTHPRPFWTDRSDESCDGADEPGEGDVMAALVRLREAPAFRMRRGPAVTTELRAAVADREIVLEPRIVTPAFPAGVRHVAGVDVTALIDLAPHSSQVPDLFGAYCRGYNRVTLRDFLFALATAVARGWLVAE